MGVSPNLLNQEAILKSQFQGMTSLPFSYKDYEEIRFRLLSILHENLNSYDREFILSILRLVPDWSRYPFQDFPSVRWKLLNLKALKKENKKKYFMQYDALSQVLLQK